MSNDEFILRVKSFALKNSDQDDIHGFPHVERVFNTCVQLGNQLKANMLILKVSALLHDVGRIKEHIDSKGRNHANISAEIAKEYLSSNQDYLSKDEIDHIIHCIRAHSFSNNIKPKTLEAKILSDADKLDAMGAIGLYRTIGFTIKNQNGIDTVIQHMEEKILNLKENLYLKSSKILAEQRQQILKDFYEKIKKEK
ncbi:MAG: HD domain-containing protein [Promethearchaeota archaeon]